MVYTKYDINEFVIQIKDLLDKWLIEQINSAHPSSVVLVIKHSEVKRGKVKMVINYKKLNKNLIFNKYFIPRKNGLINQTKGTKIFSKFDYKSGFWQIKLLEEFKSLITF